MLTAEEIIVITLTRVPKHTKQGRIPTRAIKMINITKAKDRDTRTDLQQQKNIVKIRKNIFTKINQSINQRNTKQKKNPNISLRIHLGRIRSKIIPRYPMINRRLLMLQKDLNKEAAEVAIRGRDSVAITISTQLSSTTTLKRSLHMVISAKITMTANALDSRKIGNTVLNMKRGRRHL